MLTHKLLKWSLAPLFIATSITGCNNNNSSFSSSSSNVLVRVLQELGQYIFETRASGATSASLDAPSASVYDSANQRLFVVDVDNNRVLIYSAASLTSGQSAINVLGQANFTTNASGSTAATLSAPTSVTYDATRNLLFVSDSGNNRILIYDVKTITDGEAAVYVLGQADFTANAAATTSTTLDNPTGLSYDSSTKLLFVADEDNNRILAYNLIAISNGEAAVKVLGQANYTSSGTGTTSTTLDGPYDVCVDSTNSRLFVTDTGNSRVLLYDITTISNGDAATRVLGQANLTSNATGTTAATLNLPRGLSYDVNGDRLFVGDYTNNRVLVYNVATVTNGESALRVLGQALFTTATSGTTIIKINQPLGLHFSSANDQLYVADRANNRILIFDVDTLTNGEDAISELGQGYFFTNSTNTTARGMSGAEGVAFDTANHRLFVADTANNRVLVYNTEDVANGASAVNVLGQASFTTSAAGQTAATLDSPTGLFYDAASDRLFVADSGNNRVLVYDTSFITDGDSAVAVLGQPNFTTVTAGVTAATLDTPYNVSLDVNGDRLFVVDSGNNRVLVYDVAAIANGESAVNVLGQVNFTTGTTGNTADTLDTPMSTSYDANDDRLFVADTNNNRVLIFDVSSLIDGEAAISVLGQANLTANASGITQATLDAPTGVFYDSTKLQLVVADAGNNRVLVFEKVDEVANGDEAKSVIGQTDFVTNASGLTSGTLNNPTAAAYDAAMDRLYVADTTNNRVIILSLH